MSMLSDAEIRYTIISMVSLSIITRILNMQALRTKPGFTPAGRSGNVGYDFSGIDPTSPASSVDAILSNLDVARDSLVGVFDGWVFLVSSAGWASVFVLIPSIAMFFIIINALYQVIKAMPST